MYCWHKNHLKIKTVFQNPLLQYYPMKSVTSVVKSIKLVPLILFICLPVRKCLSVGHDVIIDSIALAKQGDNVLGTIRPSADTLMPELLDLQPSFFWDCRSRVVGQRSRSRSNAKMPKNRVLTSLLPCFKVRVKGQDQGRGSRSKVKAKFLVCRGQY